MLFDDIPFKTIEKQALQAQLLDGKVPHAQLLIGREGSGALPLAIAFANLLVCEQREGVSVCGQCQGCHMAGQMVHPDIHFAFPVVTLKGKNREDTTSDDFLPLWRSAIAENPFLNIYDWMQKTDAGNSKPNINVKECHNIISKLSLRSFRGGPKVLILWLPEYLGKEGNRLLKLIEEPTDHTFILLVTENPDKILGTILSRCRLLKIFPYQTAEIAEILSKTHGVPTEDAVRMAGLSEGNLNAALRYAREEDNNFAQTFIEWLRVSYKGSAAEIVQMSNDLSAFSKDVQEQYLLFCLHFLREFHLFLATGSEPNLSAREMVIVEKMKTIIDFDKISSLSKVLENSLLYLQRNANMKIQYAADTLLIGDILKNMEATSVKEIKFV